MFTFSFSSAFAAPAVSDLAGYVLGALTGPSSVSGYDLMAAKQEARNVVSTYANLSEYSQEGQATIVAAMAVANAAIAVAEDYTTINQAVEVYKAAVTACAAFKMSAFTEKAAQLAAKLSAYVQLAAQIVGEDYMSGNYAITDNMFKVLDNFTATWYKSTGEELLDKAYEAAKAEIDELLLQWVDSTEASSATKATQEYKAAVIARLADYVDDYSLSLVTKGYETVVKNQLRTALLAAKAEINAAATVGEVENVWGKYVGVTAGDFCFSETKGIYFQPAVKGEFAKIVEAYSTGTYDVTDWNSLVAWIEANVVLEELNFTTEGGKDLTELNKLIADVYTAQAAKKVVLDASKVTATSVTGDKTAANYKTAIKAYFIGTNELTNSVVEGFAKYSALTLDNYDVTDQLVLQKAIFAYNAAVAASVKKADVRAAQAAYVAAVKDIKTHDEKLEVASIEQHKAEFEATYGPNGTAYAGKNYSPAVQAAIDFYYGIISAKYAAMKTAPADNYEHFAIGDGSDWVYALDELKALVGLNYVVTDPAKYNVTLIEGEAVCGSVGHLSQAVRLMVNDKYGLELSSGSYNNSVVINAIAVDQYYLDAEDSMATTYVKNVFNYSYDESLAILTAYNMLVSATKDFTKETSKTAADNWTAFEKAVAALDAATTTVTKTTAINTLDGYFHTSTNGVWEAFLTATTLAAEKKTAAWTAFAKYWDAKYALAQEANTALGLINAVSAESKAQKAINFWNGLSSGAMEDNTFSLVKAEKYAKADVTAVDNAITLYGIEKNLAATQADKEALANNIITVITSVVPKNADKAAEVDAAEIAYLKTLAAQYFAKYESKVFTSAAATKEALRDDIVAFGKFDMAGVKVTTKKIAGKGIQVTCDVVPGATSYKFYRATSKNGTYKFMLEKTTNTYTNTLVTKGVKYFYKVTAVVNGVETEMTTHTGIRTW